MKITSVAAIATGATIINKGSIDITEQLSNSGSITNYGSVTLQAAFANNGILDNAGSWIELKQCTNNINAQITNSNSFEIQGDLFNNANLTNTGKLLINGNMGNNATGELFNNDNIIVTGTFSNTGILNNKGSIVSSNVNENKKTVISSSNDNVSIIAKSDYVDSVSQTIPVVVLFEEVPFYTRLEKGEPVDRNWYIQKLQRFVQTVTLLANNLPQKDIKSTVTLNQSFYKYFVGVSMRIPLKLYNVIVSMPGVSNVFIDVKNKSSINENKKLIGIADDTFYQTSGVDGTGVKVGIIDTGIEFDHEAFVGQYSYKRAIDFTKNEDEVVVQYKKNHPATNFNSYITTQIKTVCGYNDQCADQTYYAQNSTLCDNAKLCVDRKSVLPVCITNKECLSYDDVTYSTKYENLYFHGSHVAGIVASNPTDQTKPKGVAPKASLYSLQVLNSNALLPVGSWSTLAKAIEYANDPSNDGDFSDRLDVVNMSIGEYYSSGITGNPALDPNGVFNQFNKMTQNLLMVGASGNNCYNTFYSVSYPSSYESVITVGSIDGTGMYYDDACKGPVAQFNTDGSRSFIIKPDIIAPGVGVYSAFLSPSSLPSSPTSTWEYESGTSMASPHVAGACALLVQNGRNKGLNLTTDEIKSALYNTTNILDNVDIMRQGSGKLAVDKALKSRSFIVPSKLTYFYSLQNTKWNSNTVAIRNKSGKTLTYHFDVANLLHKYPNFGNDITITIVDANNNPLPNNSITLSDKQQQSVTFNITVTNPSINTNPYSDSYSGYINCDINDDSEQDLTIPFAFINSTKLSRLIEVGSSDNSLTINDPSVYVVYPDKTVTALPKSSNMTFNQVLDPGTYDFIVLQDISTATSNKEMAKVFTGIQISANTTQIILDIKQSELTQYQPSTTPSGIIAIANINVNFTDGNLASKVICSCQSPNKVDWYIQNNSSKYAFNYSLIGYDSLNNYVNIVNYPTIGITAGAQQQLTTPPLSTTRKLVFDFDNSEPTNDKEIWINVPSSDATVSGVQLGTILSTTPENCYLRLFNARQTNLFDNFTFDYVFVQNSSGTMNWNFIRTQKFVLNPPTSATFNADSSLGLHFYNYNADQTIEFSGMYVFRFNLNSNTLLFGSSYGMNGELVSGLYNKYASALIKSDDNGESIAYPINYGISSGLFLGNCTITIFDKLNVNNTVGQQRVIIKRKVNTTISNPFMQARVLNNDRPSTVLNSCNSYVEYTLSNTITTTNPKIYIRPHSFVEWTGSETNLPVTNQTSVLSTNVFSGVDRITSNYYDIKFECTDQNGNVYSHIAQPAFYFDATTYVQAVLNVSKGNGYCSINDAINNATDGDVIQLDEGSYHENVIITKGITLKAKAGKKVTLVGSNANATNVTITVADVSGSKGIVTVDGIQFSGSNNAINATKINALTISNCTDKSNGTVTVASSFSNLSFTGNSSFNSMTINGNNSVGAVQYKDNLESVDYKNSFSFTVANAKSVTMENITASNYTQHFDIGFTNIADNVTIRNVTLSNNISNNGLTFNFNTHTVLMDKVKILNTQPTTAYTYSLITALNCNLSIQNSQINNCIAKNIFECSSSTITCNNCLLAHNTSKASTPKFCIINNGTLLFNNTTIVYNTGDISTGVFNAQNAIYWGNSGKINATTTTVQSSDIENGSNGFNPVNNAFLLNGNIASNPQFVDSIADFHLTNTSPCIGTGTTTTLVTDIEGTPRPSPSGTNPDMGVYENTALIETLTLWQDLMTIGGSGTTKTGSPYIVEKIGQQNTQAIIDEVHNNPSMYIGMTDQQSTIAATKKLYGDGCTATISAQDAWYALGLANEYITAPSYHLVSTTDNVASGKTTMFHGTDYIIAANHIDSNATVDFKAGNYISFVDGFKAKQGSSTHAFIITCTPLNVNSIPITEMQSLASETKPMTLKNNENIVQSNIVTSDNVTCELFPNPSHGQYTVRSNETIEYLQILSVSGINIKEMTVGQTETTFDLSGCTNAVYIAKIVFRGKSFVVRVVKN